MNTALITLAIITILLVLVIWKREPAAAWLTKYYSRFGAPGRAANTLISTTTVALSAAVGILIMAVAAIFVLLAH